VHGPVVKMHPHCAIAHAALHFVARAWHKCYPVSEERVEIEWTLLLVIRERNGRGCALQCKWQGSMTTDSRQHSSKRGVVMWRTESQAEAFEVVSAQVTVSVKKVRQVTCNTRESVENVSQDTAVGVEISVKKNFALPGLLYASQNVLEVTQSLVATPGMS
jgi:hypothetical protein